MTKHKNIQDPKNYSEAHYKFYETKLFSAETSTEELEDICMTLAHLPTKEAQDLLEKFKQSERSEEVEWLESAINEGKSLLLSPTNEQEEWDLIAHKLANECYDKIIAKLGEIENIKYKMQQWEVKYKAISDYLEKTEESEKDVSLLLEISGYEQQIILMKNEIYNLEEEIETQEKMKNILRNSIVSDKFKQLKPGNKVGWFFDGEDVSVEDIPRWED